MKHVNLMKGIKDLMTMTKLLAVFEAFEPGSGAVRSFSAAKV